MIENYFIFFINLQYQQLWKGNFHRNETAQKSIVVEKLFSYTPSGIWNPQHLRFRGRNENIKRNSTVLLFPLLYKQGNYEQTANVFSFIFISSSQSRGFASTFCLFTFVQFVFCRIQDCFTRQNNREQEYFVIYLRRPIDNFHFRRRWLHIS